MSEVDRVRLIEAEWSVPDGESKSAYAVEINIFADNRTGLLVDVSKIFAEKHIDIGQLNVRTSKQGTATMEISFAVHSVSELNNLTAQLRKIPNVLDIERKTG
jgi:GTP pyrophosphokinase